MLKNLRDLLAEFGRLKPRQPSLVREPQPIKPARPVLRPDAFRRAPYKPGPPSINNIASHM